MKNVLRGELAVCGFAAVKLLEKLSSDKIRRIYFTEEKAPLFGGLCRKMAATKRPYNMVSPAELERLSGSVHHQGVVAMIDTPVIPALNTQVTSGWVERGEDALVLDRVGNANNFGAIVRSAAFFGVRNIVLPVDLASSSVTTSSYRVAEGGMEFVSVWSVKSLPFLLSDMQGRMVRVAACVQGQTPASSLKDICVGKSTLLVMGNEESGISDEVTRLCDAQVAIPFSGELRSGVRVDSLNVAQAAAVILYEMRRA